MPDNDKKKIISQPEPFGYSKDAEDPHAQDSYLYDSNDKKILDVDSDEEGGGFGGQTGEIEFHYKDAMSVANRDDLLPPNEIKRLLIVHKEMHKGVVEKQRDTRKARESIKSGKYVAPTVAQQLSGGGSGGTSPFKKHHISDMAQFSGTDKQVVGIPTENAANTNDDLKEKLENNLELKNQLQNKNTPKFNPRLRPPGT
jgi:hypothetical protein